MQHCVHAKDLRMRQRLGGYQLNPSLIFLPGTATLHVPVARAWLAAKRVASRPSPIESVD
jgi:hypothetical protein